MVRKNIEAFVIPILAFLVPLGVYLITLSPTYIPIDSAEFTMCINYWGICHPPGFPFYVLAGKVFVTLFPFGSLSFKANLLSAIFGAGTISVLYLILSKLAVNRLVALILVLFFAVSAVFWEFSIAADVFTFATFLIALSLLFALEKRVLLAFFLLGLSASHFYITAILAPIYYWYFYKELFGYPVTRLPGYLLKTVPWMVAFGIAFFPQIVMYFRMQTDPAVNWGHAQGISGFIYFIRRQEFGSIFLLSNPVLTFSLAKLAAHFKEYIKETFLGLGVIIPISAVFFTHARWNRSIAFLVYSFAILIFVQLTLLSTIEPGGSDNPFQIAKFYLSSQVFVVILAGYGLETIRKKFFNEDNFLIPIFLGALTLVYAIVNFGHNNFSNNYFSQNYVLDALEQLPENSVAVTIDHTMYFGGRYEQEVNGKFSGVTLLYFPNEHNRDGEFYRPELFEKQIDESFMEDVSRGKSLGNAETYIAETISRNLDKPIFILQGNFEEKFFNFLKPYIVPYGLWWIIDTNLGEREAVVADLRLFDTLRNNDMELMEFTHTQQRLQAINYAVAFHSKGISLASIGEYDLALEFLQKSLEINSKASAINDEIKLIKEVKTLEVQIGDIEKSVDEFLLRDLAEKYLIIKNFPKCTETYLRLVELNSTNAEYYNNLASCFASNGREEFALLNYEKALEIDPNLEKAIKGLEVLRKN